MSNGRHLRPGVCDGGNQRVVREPLAPLGTSQAVAIRIERSGSRPDGQCHFELGKTAIIDRTTLLLGTASLGILLRFKLNPSWLVLVGGLVGRIKAGHFG